MLVRVGPGYPGRSFLPRHPAGIFCLLYHSSPEISNKKAVRMRLYPRRCGRLLQQYPFCGIFFQNMQKNSFLENFSPGFFHSRTLCNHLFTPGLWKTLWKLWKTPCPMRFSTFPHFHNLLLLCKQTLQMFWNRTKNAFFRFCHLTQYKGKT